MRFLYRSDIHCLMPRIMRLLISLLLIPFMTSAQDASYFQQEVNHTIQVTLDDVHHVLRGHIRTEYINHSPDTLRFIYFHLWPNSHKNNSTAFARQLVENGHTDFYFTADSNRGFIDSLNFIADGSPARLEIDSSNADIAKLLLPSPLLPGHEVHLATDFKVKIPYTFSRIGHVGQQYQISQWFPKPAVYDREGWHPMPYLDQGEFYSEYGTYDVTITLPANYVVAATGELMTAAEAEWLDEKSHESIPAQFTSPAHAWNADRIRKYLKTFPPSSKEMKSVQFHAENVHDFAWFADKRYVVRQSEFHPATGSQPVKTMALFLPVHAGVWNDAATCIDSALAFYSSRVGDYPYPQATAVDGALGAGGGMEYPMITVISGASAPEELDGIIAHEVGHNWFYGILGFNERDHPWMDEGINSWYEYRYMKQRYPLKKLLPEELHAITNIFDLGYDYAYQNYLFYLYFAAMRMDQPLDLSATAYTEMKYAAMIYGKTPLALDYLSWYLGEDVLDSLMRGFFDAWKFRHPRPEDFRTYFTASNHKELDWFFDQLLQTTDYTDYKLVKEDVGLTIGQSRYAQLVVKNTKQVKGPYSIAAYKDRRKSVQLSYGGFNGKMTVQLPDGDYDYFRIDPDYDLPELNRNNNYLRRAGLFKSTEPLRLQWLGSIDNPQRTQIFFAPLTGWNYYDGFTPGIAFYNSLFFPKKINVVLLPQYAIRTGRLVGLGSVSLPFYLKNSFFHSITFTSALKSYTFESGPVTGFEGDFEFRYQRFTQWLSFDIKQTDPRSSVSQKIVYRNIFLRQQKIQYSHQTQSNLPYVNGMFNSVSYSYTDHRAINPFRFEFTAEFGNPYVDNYVKVFGEGNFTVTYPRRKNGFEVRVFGGVFLNDPTNAAYKFRLSSTTGPDDYLFDQVFLGHSEQSGFLSQQISQGNDGGFKMRTNGVIPRIGESSSWILSFNLKAPMPFFMPLFAFADGGLAPSDEVASYANYDVFQYDAGIGLTLIPGIVEVYWPIFYSADMEKNLVTTDLYDQWYKRISFSFQLEEVNPFEMIRNLFR